MPITLYTRTIYLSSSFATSRQLFRNMQDIDTPVKAPTPIELPGDVIKFNTLMAPSPQQFEEEIVLKDGTGPGSRRVQ
jgi:hypothetical protein